MNDWPARHSTPLSTDHTPAVLEGLDGARARDRQAGALGGSALDDVQVERGLVQADRPVRAARDDVLESSAIPTIDVDAWFDAECHSGPKRLCVARDQVRLFMAFEPDPVAGAMGEIPAVALGEDDRARGRIDVLARDPGPNDRRRPRLRRSQDGEQMEELVVGSFRGVTAGDPQRPGHVAGIAAEEATDVEHDRFTGLDDALGGHVMRRGT